jgi:topoisomerase-4 subunit A
MRYTEARLSRAALAMMADIDRDTVDFQPTYDETEQEPVVLPSRFPNLLINGAAGIAVGMACSIPPHNAGEVCAAAIHLVRNPDATTEDLLAHMPGPDFPTGGTLIEERASILQAYETGRGGFRMRAKWEVERGRLGMWQIIVTEIPYQVQKNKLVEQIAALMEEKKLPFLGDVRDESAELVRLVLEPKTRTIDPAVLMETLFRSTQLETRFPLNMNVLTADRTPVVLGLKGVLRHWLDHRQEVLVRRTRHRQAAIAKRLEVLEGYLAVYLNLDEVIRIIREEDQPKPALIARFTLSDSQAEAILNMRLRSLRRLEEMEIRKEHATLTKEARSLATLLADVGLRWTRIAEELDQVRTRFGTGPLGDRRTVMGDVPDAVAVHADSLIEKEPITVILSEKGWIRAVRGHLADSGELKFKDGDKLGILVHCQTTDRLCLIATGGRAHTLRAGDLPRGRGDGQAIRLVAEMAQDEDVAALFVWLEGAKYLIASDAGRGFIVAAADLLAEKRTGKTIMNVKPGERVLKCVPALGDHVAVVGTSRKLLVFPLDQVPEMQRGAGVMLQKYAGGKLADLKVFTLVDGLTWRLGENTRREMSIRDWLGARAQVGRLPPNGFPRDGTFG